MPSITINVDADVARAVAGLESVDNRLGKVDTQSERTGKTFGTFVEHVRDLAVAQLAVDALSKGFPDLSFGVDAVAKKATLLAAAFTSAVAAGAPVVALAAGLGAATAAGAAGVGAFAALVKPAYTAVATGVQGATAAQTAYNLAVASGDGPGATKALESRAAALAVLTPAQRTAAEATLSLSDAFKAQSEAFSLPVLTAYTQGLSTLKSLLPDIVTVANPARDALLGIFARLDEYAQTPEFHAFLEFLSSQVGPTISKLGDIAFSFGGVLKNVFVDAAPVAQTALDVVSALVSMLDDASAGDGLRKFFTDMQPLIPIVGGLILSVVRAVGDLVTAAEPLAGPVLTAVTGLGDALGKLFQSSDFSHFVAVLGAGAQQLTPVFDVLGQVVGKVFNTLGSQVLSVLPTLIPVVEDFAKVFGDVLVGLSPLLPSIAQLVDALVTTLLPAIAPLIPALKEALVPVITELAQVLVECGPSFVALAQAIVPLLPQLTALLVAILPLVPPIVQLGTLLVQIMAEAITPLIPLITQLASAMSSSLAQSIAAISPLLQHSLDGITKFSNAFSTEWPKIEQYIKNWPGLVSILGDAFKSAYNSVKQYIGQIIDTVKEIGRGIQQAFAAPDKILFEVGKAIIKGLIDGIVDKLHDVKQTLNDLTAQIPQWKGPASRDATLLTDAGRLIMQGLVDGLDKGEAGVMRQLQGTTAKIAGAFDGTSGTVTASLSGFGAGATRNGSAGGVVVVNQYFEVPPNPDLIGFGQVAAEAITAYQNAGGRQ